MRVKPFHWQISGMALMPSNLPINIIASQEFQRRLKALARRYRKIRSDLQPILETLQAGTFLGDQISGTSYTVLKLRIKNTDAQKGKRGGYRLIYQIVSSSEIRLVLIYSKSDQTDVLTDEIIKIIKEMTQE
jgi:mRNA-degrading endonuclease RelE of RelBE toxin-antitoxin system